MCRCFFLLASLTEMGMGYSAGVLLSLVVVCCDRFWRFLFCCRGSASCAGVTFLLAAMQKVIARSVWCWCLENVLPVFKLLGVMMAVVACTILVSGRGDGTCLLLPRIVVRGA